MTSKVCIGIYHGCVIQGQIEKMCLAQIWYATKKLSSDTKGHAGLRNVEDLVLPDWRHIAEHYGHSVKSLEILFVIRIKDTP